MTKKIMENAEKLRKDDENIKKYLHKQTVNV